MNDKDNLPIVRAKFEDFMSVTDAKREARAARQWARNLIVTAALAMVLACAAIGGIIWTIWACFNP